MPINLKGLFSGGLKGLGDTAKGIIAQVAENKMTVAEADILLEKELNRHEEAMEASAIKEVELHLNDKANARNREIEVAKVTGHSDYMNWMLAIVALGLLVYITVRLSHSEIPKANEHILINLIGIIEGCVLGIYSYQFGSSIGSRIKDMIKR
jgi:hypothetical protein